MSHPQVTEFLLELSLLSENAAFGWALGNKQKEKFEDSRFKVKPLYLSGFVPVC